MESLSDWATESLGLGYVVTLRLSYWSHSQTGLLSHSGWATESFLDWATESLGLGYGVTLRLCY